MSQLHETISIKSHNYFSNL